eukprot:9227938-Alexandrium_andersonii.AAC.1
MAVGPVGAGRPRPRPKRSDGWSHDGNGGGGGGWEADQGAWQFGSWPRNVAGPPNDGCPAALHWMPCPDRERALMAPV